MATYLRGKIDAESSHYGWILRTRFYSADGNYIRYADADRGYNGQKITTTWQRVAGTVTAPVDATTMRIDLYFLQANGWVTFDDVSVTSSAEISKYYAPRGRPNGQRYPRSSRMNKNGILTYLHSDHTHLHGHKLLAVQLSQVIQQATPSSGRTTVATDVNACGPTPRAQFAAVAMTLTLTTPSLARSRIGCPLGAACSRSGRKAT